MSTKIQINRLTNANIYLDGVNLLGRAEEFMSPTVKYKTGEHKALGMIGTFDTFSGIDKMEAKIKWNSFYYEPFAKLGNPFQNVKLMVRASLESYDSGGRTAELPVVIYLTAQAKDFPTGNFKQHDNVELETNLNVYSAKVEIDGSEMLEVDILSNIFKIDGVDLLANYRANIGA